MTGNTWHVCKGGCGFLIGLLREGLFHYRPGSIAHCKPEAFVNRRPAPCELYHRLSCEELYRLHENEPVVPGPENITPAVEENEVEVVFVMVPPWAGEA